MITRVFSRRAFVKWVLAAVVRPEGYLDAGVAKRVRAGGPPPLREAGRRALRVLYGEEGR